MPSPLAGEGGAQRRVRGLTGHSIWQRSLARSFSQLFQQGFEFAGVQRPGEVKQEEGAEGETDEGQRDAVEIIDPAGRHDPGHDGQRRQPEDEADAQLEEARTDRGSLSAWCLIGGSRLRRGQGFGAGSGRFLYHVSCRTSHNLSLERSLSGCAANQRDVLSDLRAFQSSTRSARSISVNSVLRSLST